MKQWLNDLQLLRKVDRLRGSCSKTGSISRSRSRSSLFLPRTKLECQAITSHWNAFETGINSSLPFHIPFITRSYPICLWSMSWIITFLHLNHHTMVQINTVFQRTLVIISSRASCIHSDCSNVSFTYHPKWSQNMNWTCPFVLKWKVSSQGVSLMCLLPLFSGFLLLIMQISA